MDKKLKAKWVRALRSGRYKQGKGLLQRGERNCCLGVLCRIAKIPFTKKAGRLDQDMLRKVGLSEVRQTSLITMNDGAPYADRLTFPQIADWIEKHL